MYFYVPAKISNYIIFSYVVDEPSDMNLNTTNIDAGISILRTNNLEILKGSKIEVDLDPNHIDLISTVEKSATTTIYASPLTVTYALYEFMNAFSSASEGNLWNFIGSAIKLTRTKINGEQTYAYKKEKLSSTWYGTDDKINSLITLKSKIELDKNISQEGDGMQISCTVSYPKDNRFQASSWDKKHYAYRTSKVSLDLKLSNRLGGYFSIPNIYGGSTSYKIKKIVEGTDISKPIKLDSKKEEREKKWGWGKIERVIYSPSPMINEPTMLHLTTSVGAVPVILDQDGKVIDISIVQMANDALNKSNIMPEAGEITVNWDILMTLSKPGFQTLYIFDQNNMNEELISFDMTVNEAYEITAMVTTKGSTNIANNSAILNGSLTNIWNGLEYGFYWGTTENPDTKFVVNMIDPDYLDFTFKLEGLTTGTIYYFKAFAGDTEGEVLSFIASDGPETFTLAINAEVGGEVTVGESGEYEQGQEISISAEPDSGYMFAGWISTGGSFANENSASTAFTMPAEDVEITANFELMDQDEPLITIGGNTKYTYWPVSGPTIDIPIKFNCEGDTLEVPSSGYSFTINYDTNILKFAGPVIDIQKSLLINEPSDQPGTIKVQCAPAGGLNILDITEILVPFTVIGVPDLGDTTILELSNAKVSKENPIDGDYPYVESRDVIINFSSDLIGDINGDGIITPEDAIILLQMYVGLILWTPQALLVGDINGDGVVDTTDSALILRMIVGG
jgi:hypothetical protein